MVQTDQPIRQILQKSELSGRMIARSIKLSEFGIQYQPQKHIKSQVLSDFYAELSPWAELETQPLDAIYQWSL